MQDFNLCLTHENHSAPWTVGTSSTLYHRSGEWTGDKRPQFWDDATLAKILAKIEAGNHFGKMGSWNWQARAVKGGLLPGSDLAV